MSTVALQLPTSTAATDASVIHAQQALPVRRRLEPVGRAWFTKVKGEQQEAEEQANPTTTDKKDEPTYKLDVDLGDYYALLGLEHLTFDATEEDIRKAHRTVSVATHPDKARTEDRQKAEDRFKALTVGFETLIDPVRRRAYESTLPFNDAIPSASQGTKSDEDFFKAYGPVFERNARFSTVKPVPLLGDMSSSNDAVNEFYDFWFSFKSWRSFEYLNEHKPEQASGRDEKRWMQRENEKKQANKKKEEVARVRKLVEDAMKKDPRIKRMRAEEEAEKNRRKNAKHDQARKLKEEAEAKAKAEAEEKKRKEEAEKQAAADKKEARLALKLARSNFAKYCRAAGFSNEEDIEALRNSLEIQQFNEVNELFKTDAQSAKAKEMVEAFIKKHHEQEVSKQ